MEPEEAPASRGPVSPPTVPPPPVPEDPPPPDKKKGGGGGGGPSNCPCECKCDCVTSVPTPPQVKYVGVNYLVTQNTEVTPAALEAPKPQSSPAQATTLPTFMSEIVQASISTEDSDSRLVGRYAFRRDRGDATPPGEFKPPTTAFKPLGPWSPPTVAYIPYQGAVAPGPGGAGAGPQVFQPHASPSIKPGFSNFDAGGFGFAAKYSQGAGGMYQPSGSLPQVASTFATDAAPGGEVTSESRGASRGFSGTTAAEVPNFIEAPVAPPDTMRIAVQPLGVLALDVVSPPGGGSFWRGGSMAPPAAGLRSGGGPTTGDGSAAAGVAREATSATTAPASDAMTTALPPSRGLQPRQPAAPAQQGLGSIETTVIGAGTVPQHFISGPAHGAPAPYPSGKYAPKSPLAAAIAPPAFDQTPAGHEAQSVGNSDDPKAMRPPTNPRPPKIAPDAAQRGKGGGGIAAFAASEAQDQQSRTALDKLNGAHRTLDRLERSDWTIDALERRANELSQSSDQAMKDAGLTLREIRGVAMALLATADAGGKKETAEQRAQREATRKAAEKDATKPGVQDALTLVLQNEKDKKQANEALASIGPDAEKDAREAVDRDDQDAHTKLVDLGRQLGLSEKDIATAVTDKTSQVRKLLNQETQRQKHQTENQVRRAGAKAERTRYGEYRAQADAALRSSRSSRDRANTAHNDLSRLSKNSAAKSIVKDGLAASKEAAAAAKTAKLLAKKAKDAAEAGNGQEAALAAAAAEGAAKVAGAASGVTEAIAKQAAVKAHPVKSWQAQKAAQARADADVAQAKAALALTKASLPDPKTGTSLVNPHSDPNVKIAEAEAKKAEGEAQFRLDIAFIDGEIDLKNTTWPHCPSPYLADCQCKPACDSEKHQVPHSHWVNGCTHDDSGAGSQAGTGGTKGKGTATVDPHATSDRGAEGHSAPAPSTPAPTVTPSGGRGPDEDSSTVSPDQAKPAKLGATAAPESAHGGSADAEKPEASEPSNPDAKVNSTDQPPSAEDIDEVQRKALELAVEKLTNRREDQLSVELERRGFAGAAYELNRRIKKDPAVRAAIKDLLTVELTMGALLKNGGSRKSPLFKVLEYRRAQAEFAVLDVVGFAKDARAVVETAAILKAANDLDTVRDQLKDLPPQVLAGDLPQVLSSGESFVALAASDEKVRSAILAQGLKSFRGGSYYVNMDNEFSRSSDPNQYVNAGGIVDKVRRKYFPTWDEKVETFIAGSSDLSVGQRIGIVALNVLGAMYGGLLIKGATKLAGALGAGKKAAGLIGVVAGTEGTILASVAGAHAIADSSEGLASDLATANLMAAAAIVGVGALAVAAKSVGAGARAAGGALTAVAKARAIEETAAALGGEIEDVRMVLLDTVAARNPNAVEKVIRPGEIRFVDATVVAELAGQVERKVLSQAEMDAFLSGAGRVKTTTNLDEMKAVATAMREFNRSLKPGSIANDAAIGGTARELGVGLITFDEELATGMRGLGHDVRGAVSGVPGSQPVGKEFTSWYDPWDTVVTQKPRSLIVPPQ
jgi:hypothetical protein